jgi:hypothetical protein
VAGRLSCAALCVFPLDLPLSVPVAVPLRRSLDRDTRPALPLFWTSPSLGKCLNIFLPLPAEVFLHGDWDPEATGLPRDDPEIRRLLSDLQLQASSSRAASTLATYAGPWRRFKAWCLEKGVSFLPAPPLVVALYFTRLLASASSPSPILSCSAAIYLHHSIAGLPSPTAHPLVAMAREIAKRTRVAGRNVKRPLLASHIRKLFELWLYADSSNLHTVMKLSAVCLCYAGFLRFSDLMSVQWHKIRFLPSHMELFLEKSKTDQYRAGRWVLISRVGGLYCPVQLVEFPLAFGQYASLGPGPLVRSTTISFSQQSLRKEQPAYTTVNAWFKEGVRLLGLDPALYKPTRSDARSERRRPGSTFQGARLLEERACQGRLRG